jgi:hypothetical protein
VVLLGLQEILGSIVFGWRFAQHVRFGRIVFLLQHLHASHDPLLAQDVGYIAFELLLNVNLHLEVLHLVVGSLAVGVGVSGIQIAL